MLIFILNFITSTVMTTLKTLYIIEIIRCDDVFCVYFTSCLKSIECFEIFTRDHPLLFTTLFYKVYS